MQDWVRDYLRTLTLLQEKPSRAFLKKIIRAHIRTFPFENISKLISKEQRNGTVSIPGPEEFLASHHNRHTGGTCFALNANLLKLLKALGFEGYYIHPGEDHMAIVLKDPESSHNNMYVDVGTTAPLFDPISFEGRKKMIPAFAGEKLLFLPGPQKGVYSYIRVRGDQIINKKWTFSIYDELEEKEFYPWVKNTYKDTAPFMNKLRCQLWQPEKRRGLSINNRHFTIRNASGGVLVKSVSDRESLRCILHEEFNFPRLPLDHALSILEEKQIALFEETKKERGS
ncbi:arylamine N-acetyltransferase [Alteribacillus sp. HJP-4]|uniref:arylamine N-acetyltransferase n=1 Tax=Alteribacillus sp. HJP-4 TaxID=2775394 RepID=UPI0035CD36BE